MPEVTIVIPHWNRRDLLANVLKHLAAQSYPIAEILVVDNGSEDDSVDLAEQAGARVILMGRNAGFAAAVNRGVAECKTELLAIVNNDVTFEPKWLEELVLALEQDGGWFATGKLLKAASPSRIDGSFDAISRGGCAWRCGNGRMDGPVWTMKRRITFVPLTAALFRHELFRKVGELDSRFESYLEDVDFGMRCARVGLDGWYVPAAEAIHVGSGTLGAWNNDTVRRISRNQIFLYRKYLRGAFWWPVLVGQLLWGIVAFRHGAGRAFLRGKWEGFRLRRDIAGFPGDIEIMRTIVMKSEREIWDLQQLTGFNLYWTLYFALAGRPEVDAR